jgi:hypothetical protein
MAYIRDHARFTILDDVPADVWQEPTTHDTGSDPDRYLCIVSEEPHDYDGSFTACVFSQALYQREHVGASTKYLKTCTLAPEDTARKILAFYLRQWARIEDDDTAALLLDSAEEIARG